MKAREDIFADPRYSYLVETQTVKNADGDANQPNILFGITLFREMSLSSFGSNKLESINHVDFAWLMYKLLSDNEEDTMTKYKKETPEQLIIQNEIDCLMILRKKYSLVFGRVYLKGLFGFKRHLDKINYGLGYTLTMKHAQ